MRLHGHEQCCPAQSLIIWDPGEPQRYGHPSADWEYSWLQW